MATATVVRPTQALRRRDAPRPTVAKRQLTMEGVVDGASKKRKLDEPHVRTQEYVLRKFNGRPPSLTIHLHPTHFKFEGQDGSFSYDSEMKFILEHLKQKTVPHQMMQELLENGVQFFDGCLIVEVHNHRTKEGKDIGRHDSAADADTVKFSMHNYNEHITPSPMVPFPSKARTDNTPEKSDSRSIEMPAPERPKEKDGPRIFTAVLFPTALSLHHEMLILANTPASEVRNKKRGSDSTTPSSAHPPPTPQLSVPPTPIGQSARGTSSQSQKMCLEPEDFYTFQADVLVTTEPPLYLEPVDNPQDAQKVLDLLQHPLHQERPPSPKTRKRTTAELAADDALKQETERRMLIMDERIKPSGTGAAANENQGAATSLTFSRFKTLDMVKQKLEEAERLKKEEEFRVSQEKKQAEEQAQQQQKLALQQRQREMALMSQQQPNQQAMLLQQQRQQQQLRDRAMAQQAQIAQQNHAHPQQNAMMQNQPQNFQQANQVSMAQSSPIVRQQTPMMNSSPMMTQNTFPTNQAMSSAAAAGSPPRPTSATMHHPMARQTSQQQQGSRGATPQIAQATPSMGQAVPNRQMTQTPRLPPGSPAPGMQQGTPTSASMTMQTPHMGNQNFTPEQMAMIAQQQQRLSQGSQNGGPQAGSPQNMTPEQIQSIQNQRRVQQSQLMQRNAMMQAQAAQAAGNPQLAQQIQMQQKQRMMQHQQQMMMQAQQNAQMHGSPGPGQAGSPGAMQQQTPQMGHAHPQQQQGQQGNMQDQSQMTPQQQQQSVANAQVRANHLAQMRAQAQQQQANLARQQLQPLIQQYGGLQNIPQNIIQGLPPQVQNLLRQQWSQNQARQAQVMRAQQQNQGGGGEQVPGGQPNPQYMQQLRNNQMALQAQMQNSQQQQQQQQQGGMNGMTGMSFHMNGLGQNFGNQQGGGGGADLTQQFAAMQNALTRGQQGGGGQGMQ